MVFSFFKKEPEKMVARPAAVPRSKDPQALVPTMGDAQFEISGVGIQSDIDAHKAAKDDLPPLDFSEFVFSESSPDFQIEADVDPVDAQRPCPDNATDVVRIIDHQ